MSHEPDSEAALVEAALELPPNERVAYLARACEDDARFRQVVEALFRSNPTATDKSGSSVASESEVSAQIWFSPTEKAGDRIGPYKLLQQIGEGGCGIVYMAEQDEPIRRRVALKVIKLGMDTKQVIARFKAERQALALMDHPNIAKVLDAGATANGRPYFVMELVKGIKFTDYCDQHNLPTAQRLELFIQVCKAIQHAHQKGIIHRDIKPSNILVTLHDGLPVPKVIDFGIAKATEQRLTDKTLFTALEQFMGTPAYMSPEQAQMSGLDIDTRSDIYSLGVLLYELLTGKTPFEQRELAAAGIDGMRQIILEKDPIRPSTRLSNLDAQEQTNLAKRRQIEPPKLIHLVRGDLDWIVMRCLEKDRTRRYETANDLGTDVQRHLDNETVLARPPTTVYRFQRMVRRNRLAFAAATAVTTALLIGLGVSTWLYFRERTAHHRAQEAEQAERRANRDAEAARQNEALQQKRAETDAQRARSEAKKSRHAEALFREALGNIRSLSSQDPAKETPAFALLLHHLADLLRGSSALAEARLLVEESTAMYWRHADWPIAEQQHALEVRAAVLVDLGDLSGLGTLYPEALVASAHLVERWEPPAVSTLRRLARIYYEAGFTNEARVLYRRAIDCYTPCAEAGDFDALNGLAWLLATCSDQAVRDGMRAVSLAERAVKITNRRSSKALDTLAAAYAEAGQFAAAIKAERDAMALVTDDIAWEGLNNRLRLYEANRPCHE